MDKKVSKLNLNTSISSNVTSTTNLNHLNNNTGKPSTLHVNHKIDCKDKDDEIIRLNGLVDRLTKELKMKAVISSSHAKTIAEKEQHIEHLLDRLRKIDQKLEGNKDAMQIINELNSQIQSLKSNEHTLMVHNKQLEDKLLKLDPPKSNKQDLKDKNKLSVEDLKNRIEILTKE